MFFEVLPYGADSKVSKKQTIRNHERENGETQTVEILQHQPDRDDDEEKHEFVQERANRSRLPPPVVCFDGADLILEHRPALLYPRIPSNRGFPSFGAARAQSLATARRPDASG